MQDIVNLPINFNVDYAQRHKPQLTHFYNYFQNQIKNNIRQPLLSYTVHEEHFDNFGTLWVKKNQLDKKNLKLIQLIEEAYMSTSFFSSNEKQIGSRGCVYYASAIIDDDNMRSLLRLINHTSTSVQLLGDEYKKYMDRWEFGIYALLDDIRYKMLILEDNYESLISEELLNDVVSLFYGYLQGTLPTNDKVISMTKSANTALLSILKSAPPLESRSYKEADHPLQNIIFRETLLNQIKNVHIDLLLGIRFGGSELPHLLNTYLPHTNILKVRSSKYSDNTQSNINIPKSVCANSSVLILDDNILTGRTLQDVITVLKKNNVNKVFFGCITYSGIKRYPQMIMKNHGVINPDVLTRSCVIAESEYTKITSSKSYKNSSGVFDKVKSGLQKRVKNPHTGYKL